MTIEKDKKFSSNENVSELKFANFDLTIHFAIHFE